MEFYLCEVCVCVCVFAEEIVRNMYDFVKHLPLERGWR